jgi:hypothetical protein
MTHELQADWWNEDAFVNFDAYLPARPHWGPALERVSAVVGMVSFVLLAGIVLGRR